MTPINPKRTNKTPRLSVVIPSYRSEKMILNCLQSVFDQDFEHPFEVIVVDSSPESIEQIIKKDFPQVRFVYLEKRTLPGKARSLGAAQAKGDVVFFTDTDCIVDPLWMQRLWARHLAGHTVVGGGVVNGTPKSIGGTCEYLVEFNEMNPWAKAGTVRALPSCNLSAQSKILKKVGYFPDFLKGEDTIFCENVRASGEAIFFEPKAQITHLNRTAWMHFIRNQISLGEGSHETRKRTRRYGYFLLKYPFLVPFIPTYRTVIIGKRLFCSSRWLFLQFVALYPLIGLGLLAYVWGFIRGSYRSGLSTEVSEKE